MKVTRDVVVDLLPVYLSGEASPDTRSLVEEYLKQDEDLARSIRRQWTESLAKAAPSALPPELELRTLSRTRRLLGRQKWLFGLAIAFTAFAFTLDIRFADGGVKDVRLLLFDYPGRFGPLLVLGAACWLGYWLIRRRLRTTAL